jgi:RimJ/RimL family protein N-acetyltransferase
MPAVPVLRTERVLLREWRDGDRGPFAAMNADPVVMEHFPAVLTVQQSDALVDRIVEHWTLYGYGLWAVDVDGRFAGFVGLSQAGFQEWFTPAVEVGWRMDRPFWGRGLATEAAAAALGYGFAQVGLEEILSWTAVSNFRSWLLMERIGMQRICEFEHPRVPVGHPLRQHVLYRAKAQD